MPAYGEAVFQPSEATVGTLATFCLRYTVGEEAIEPGGGIRVEGLRQFFAQAQTHEPGKVNYVSVSTSGRESRATLALSPPNPREASPALVLEVRVGGARLTRGDTITITFGDIAHGSPGFQVHSLSHTHQLQVQVDRDGSHNYIRLADPPRFSCRAAAPVHLVALAPSQVTAGRKFDVHVKAVDAFGNPATSYRGTVYFASEECDLLPPEYTFQEKDRGARRFEAAAASAKMGFNRITVRDRENGLSCATNPIDVTDKPPEFGMYWGDLHGHSLFSDGNATPDEHYRYGRDAEMLDVCALSDHDLSPPDAWPILRYEADRFYEPERFVTFFGYEWTTGRSPATVGMSFGHKSIYYCDGGEPVYSHEDRESDTPQKLFTLLSRKRAIVVPHHPSAPLSPARRDGDGTGGCCPAGSNWRFHDPEKERLVEIYSKCGNSEFPGCSRPPRDAEPGGFVQEALARGYRLGFTAGSDSHCGRPGADVEGDNLYRRSGLTLFWAERLTREAVFEAMAARRCYATTGPRIFLDFKINGFHMGEEIVTTDPEESRAVTVRVAGTATIEHIDIIKNNDDLYRHEGGGQTVEFEYVDQTPASESDFYYIRVTQADEEMAWSSPIWVTARK